MRATALVLVTAALHTGSLIFREYGALRQDQITNAKSLGRLLATTLVTPISHDDVWRAYEIITSRFGQGTQNHGPQSSKVLLVLDPNYRVYVSTRPSEYPMLSDPGVVSPHYRSVQDAIRVWSATEPFPLEVEGSQFLYVITPMLSDGVALGTLVATYSKAAFLPRFFAIA